MGRLPADVCFHYNGLLCSRQDEFLSNRAQHRAPHPRLYPLEISSDFLKLVGSENMQYGLTSILRLDKSVVNSIV